MKTLPTVLSFAVLAFPAFSFATGLETLKSAAMKIDSSAILRSAETFTEARKKAPNPSLKKTPSARITVPQEPLEFDCVIPDHGGSCNTFSAKFSHDAEGVTALRLTNLSASERPSFTMTDIGAGVEKDLLLLFIEDKRHDAREGLSLDSGDNLIRIEFLKDGKKVSTQEKTLKASITWSY